MSVQASVTSIAMRPPPDRMPPGSEILTAGSEGSSEQSRQSSRLGTATFAGILSVQAPS